VPRTTSSGTPESIRRRWPAPGAGAGFSGFGDVFSDIFGEIFGGAGRSRALVGLRGADLRYNLEISLEQAAKGFETRIRIPTMAECATCKGSGAKPGTQPQTCTTCRGAGQVRVSQGPFSIAQTCPRCHGTGKMIANPCTACSGAGRVKHQKTLQVRIPSGVDEGDRVRLTSEGEPGVNGGPPGDLYVQVHIKPHPVFQRDHDDLHCEMPVSFSIAALGGDIDIPTLDGTRRSRCPRNRRAARRSACAARASRACAAISRRPVLPRRRRDAGQPHRPAKGAAARIRDDQPGRCGAAQPAQQGLVRQGEGILRGLNRPSPTCP
jgi:DnaJ-class molecular chaperone